MTAGPATQAIVDEARALAQRAHADQRRKSGDLPYFTHLEAVAQLVERHGHGDPLTVAAAYLHDLLEDQPAFEGELRALMPSEVVETVEVLSEKKLDDNGNKRPKSARFEDYFAALQRDHPASRRALPISAADKIHNAQSLSETDPGERLMLTLNTRPAEQREQLQRLRALYTGRVAPSLLSEFDRAARELARTIEAWLPTRAAQIAADAQLGRLDARGQPCALRAFELALAAEQADERQAALLCDALGCGAWLESDLLREGFSECVVRAASALARRDGEDEPAHLARVVSEPLAARLMLLALERDLPAWRQDRARARWLASLRSASISVAGTRYPGSKP